jgi:uncharacterized protein YndB with AHSA1/START domain
MSDAERGEVRLEIHIEASPRTVFALLTDPTEMKTWLAELVVAESRPGGRFHAAGALGTIEGTYFEVIPNAKVVFTWGGVEGLAPGQSTVEFLLEPIGKGTLVKLRHYGLPRRAVDMHRRVWERSGLTKIKDSAEGRTPTVTCLSDAIAHGN